MTWPEAFVVVVKVWTLGLIILLIVNRAFNLAEKKKAARDP